MPQGQLGLVIQQLRRLVGADSAPNGTDGQLLQRFVCDHDEAAFTTLAERYGPLVLSVCRRILRDPHAVEDAFQATFLILAKKAASIRKSESLGSWLHGVAHRVAVRAKSNAARRQALEQSEADMSHAEPSAPIAGPADVADWQEIAAILDEELRQLPEKHRAPLVLCYLKGQTNEQAAVELCCPPCSMSWRLSQAREQLRARLTRRGVALSAAALGTHLATQAAPAVVPAALLHGAVQGALAGTASSASATALAEGVMQTMGVTRMKIAIAFVVMFGALGSGLGVFAYRTPGPANETTSVPTETVKEEPKGGPPVKGLKLVLTADKTETTLNADGTVEPVKLTVRFTNVSDKPIKLDAYYLTYRKLALGVKGPDEESLEKPVAGIDLVMEKAAARDYPMIAPGKDWAFDCTFPGKYGIDRWFLVKKPGTFRIQFTYTLKNAEENEFAANSWTGEAVSNEIEVKAKDPPAGNAVKGLKLGLSADRTETTMWPDGSNAEPVNLKLTFTNVSDKPIKLNAYDLNGDHLNLTVTGPDAQSVRVTERIVDRKRVGPKPEDFPEIKPGATWEKGIYGFPGERYAPLSKSQEFALLKAGTYRVKVAYTNGFDPNRLPPTEYWTGELASNDLELKVKAADAGDAVKGLKLTLGSDVRETRLTADGSDAEPVKLKLTFTNTSDKPIKLLTHEFQIGLLGLTVKGPDEKSVQAKASGITQRPAPVTEKSFTEIMPGKSITHDIEFPGTLGPIDYAKGEFSNYPTIALVKAGEYRIRFTYANGRYEPEKVVAGSWSGELSSNELVLSVKGAK